MTRKSELQMAKKDNFNNNDPISKAVDLLLEPRLFNNLCIFVLQSTSSD
ncbi:hypothetical protein [Spiroplasma endosymbiont of Cleonymus obscurus]